MHEQVFLNGSFLPKEDAKISIMDRGFLLGDGIYELLPVYNGKPFLLNKHLSRLNTSLELIEMNANLSEELDIEKIVNELINKNKYKNHFIYIQITRGTYSDRNHIYQSTIKPTLVVMGQLYIPFSFNQVKMGYKATIHEDYRWKRANIKSISLLGNVLLKNHADKQGMYETILIYDNKVTECSASNIFIVKENTVITPKLGNELLSGVTRNLTLEILQKNKFNVEQLDISKEEIISADEIWCSSSTNPVVPIIEVDGKVIGEGFVGDVTLATYKLISEFIEDY